MEPSFHRESRLRVEGTAMQTILPILFPSTFVMMLVLERVFPGRPLPKVRFWVVKGMLFFVFTGFVSSAVPALVSKVLGGHSVLHLAWLGTVPGAIVGYLMSDFIGYWMHRAKHKSSLLWR